jgi:hypothetical protein
MRLIAEGKEAVELIKNSESLISGKLKKISIYTTQGRLFVELDVELPYSNLISAALIQLRDVVEYSFYYHVRTSFYNIEDYIFSVDGEYIYLSLDPVNGSRGEPDENDNDFVLARDMAIYKINDT